MTIARLLEYPSAGCDVELPPDADPETARLLGDFAREIEGLSTEQLEELYTRTFDINPVCSLEVGWQLFGENYDRGSFLVWMRQQLRRFGLRESAELPDHLTHALALYTRLEGEEARQFASRFLCPAIDKMLAGFAGKNNPYENVLRAILQGVEP